MIIDVFETEPDFINEEGVKWWKDDILNEKAKDINGVTWLTQLPNGYKSRVLLINDEVDYEHPNLEAMAAHIDMIKLSENEDD